MKNKSLPTRPLEHGLIATDKEQSQMEYEHFHEYHLYDKNMLPIFEYMDQSGKFETQSVDILQRVA